MGVCLASEREQYIDIGLQKLGGNVCQKRKPGVRLENELENVP